jgi:hypothetical protein
VFLFSWAIDIYSCYCKETLSRAPKAEATFLRNFKEGLALPDSKLDGPPPPSRAEMQNGLWKERQQKHFLGKTK